MKKSVVLFVFTLFGILSASSKNYIASSSGVSTGAGTLDTPYDVATAVSKAVAGDTVYLRGGQYMMTAQLALSKGGSESAYIKVWAYPGDARVVLDFYNRGYSGSNASSERGVTITKSYYHLRGLDITHAGDNGMHISGSYNIIENCRFYKNCDAGLQITGSSVSEGYNQIIDCDSYQNFDFKTSGGAGGNADGFACKLTVGPGNKFIRCRSWENSDDAYDCYGSVNDIYFRDCWAMANGQASYNVTEYPGSTGYTTVTNTGNGNGFKVGGNSCVGGAVLIGCVSTGHKIMSSSNKGFDQNNNVGRVYCFNCLSYNDGRGFSFPNNTDTRGEHLFYNNVVLSANNSNSIKSTSIQLTNTWNSITVSTSDFISLAVDSAKADRDASGALPYMGGLFRLKSSSNLINKGTVVAVDTTSLPYKESAPDLGPFEYSPASAVKTISDSPAFSLFYSRATKTLGLKGAVVSVKAFDLSGRNIFSRLVDSEAVSIPVGGWQKGVFLVNVSLQDGTVGAVPVLID
jgi:pectate disaccharide-lyase